MTYEALQGEALERSNHDQLLDHDVRNCLWTIHNGVQNYHLWVGQNNPEKAAMTKEIVERQLRLLHEKVGITRTFEELAAGQLPLEVMI